jgi:para-aminobenzoate synthetase/4-amino-4-deoxychorismate lyase
VLLESHQPSGDGRSFLFARPVEQIRAHRATEVLPALERVERAVAAGRHAAGFLCYEAAPGLDRTLRTHAPTALPLAWFGIFEERIEIAPGEFGSDEDFTLSDWRPALDAAAYARIVGRIRDYIAAGDTYQVNFTFHQFARLSGSPFGLYRALCRSQRADFCAYIDLGDRKIVSASPELFFRLEGTSLTVRPMKGTMPRGRWCDEDDALAQALAQCPKNRAENVMIVDLMRNDLGRLAETGTVHVPRLWEVERYETLLQMTSTIGCRLRPGIGLPALFAAIFPSGSVTGAPKVRTMQLIEELEEAPRGLYTGAIGYVSPGPEAVFNVAIRTVVLERGQEGEADSWRAEFGIGSGITYDSDPAREYEECRLKSQFLIRPLPEFDLLETLLWEPPGGYFLLARHLERLEGSARYFGFRYDRARIEHCLEETARSLAGKCSTPTGREARHKVRLVLGRRGDPAATATALPLEPAPSSDCPKVAVCGMPVDSGDPFLYHKTTWRDTYSHRARSRPDCADVVLVNERGEVTESTIANVVVQTGEGLFTPPVASGLLPGTFRAELLAAGRIAERVLFPEALRRAPSVYLINSVRKWVRVSVIQ